MYGDLEIILEVIAVLDWIHTQKKNSEMAHLMLPSIQIPMLFDLKPSHKSSPRYQQWHHTKSSMYFFFYQPSQDHQCCQRQDRARLTTVQDSMFAWDPILWGHKKWFTNSLWLKQALLPCEKLLVITMWKSMWLCLIRRHQQRQQ